ncbi:uncharacterized protein LOC124899439 [Capsicum annuum]|uniref:uncharacterized protein LOC124899439 n=1 Tax=Capsicum annuum TaxID=4072 RepID=UPI001FB12A81|nr:uncharacterized protein LOC124899439 [Capsicum annuum]
MIMPRLSAKRSIYNNKMKHKLQTKSEKSNYLWLPVMQAKVQGKGFSLNPLVDEQIAFTGQSSIAEMWNKRLGHFHHKALLFMQRSKMVKRGNLDEKTEPGVFIGYNSMSKAYKIFQPQSGKIVEEIYVEQPERFSVPRHEDMVYLLNKALYGLKKAPRSWYSRMDNHLLDLGFEKSLSESTLYVKKVGSNIIIISPYVDDLLMTENNITLIEEFKEEMMRFFEMTDLGEMTYFLGMEIKQTQNKVFICQKKYMKEILKRFRMEECKSVNTLMNKKEKLKKDDGAKLVDEGAYRSLIGCLMYFTTTRPDILFPEIVAQSTAEAKFIAAAATVNQAIWLRKILIDLQLEQEESTVIFVDNQASIAISKDPMFHGRTKHFNIKFYFLREVQKNGELVLLYCKLDNQVGDIFTKSFHVSRFEFLREKLGI